MATSWRSVSSTVIVRIFVVRRQSEASTALWIVILGTNKAASRYRIAAALQIALAPQSLLQIIESLNNFFLNQVLAFRNHRLAAHDDFAHGRACQRKHDACEQVVGGRAGERRIVK